MELCVGEKVIKEEPAKATKHYGSAGQRVIYRDGYESWSPKDVFEAGQYFLRFIKN